MNIIERVLDAMQTDDANTDRQSKYLEALYNRADDTGKELIDDCMIALCGWSLKTLLNNGVVEDD